MAKTLYLMRHGQTLFNLRHKVQGWCDAPLTDFGIYQAKVAGQYFKDAGITFDDAYSSTQERACDTLELVRDSRSGTSAPLKGKAKTSIHPCLMEISLLPMGVNHKIKCRSVWQRPFFSSCRRRMVSLCSWSPMAELWPILPELGRKTGVWMIWVT